MWNVSALLFHNLKALTLAVVILCGPTLLSENVALVHRVLLPVTVLVILALPLAVALVILFSPPLRYSTFTSPSEVSLSGGSSVALKPLLFECRTTHTRLFPTKHSFSYHYLLTGVPVEWNGSAGTILSAGMPRPGKSSTQTWFSVNEEDYLERGRRQGGLYEKLKDYLLTQNAAICDFPYAYLVTAPRFLGFSFNPVSFWYLYDVHRVLRAMILEVNNTFDERRMYFLRSTDPSDVVSKTFTHEWLKDFHVSPFNDRDGSYSLAAVDPAISKAFQIDNTIVLNSPEGKPKIVARVFSTSPGIDAAGMSAWPTLNFVMRWGWVGFMTNPRILREARMLWMKKLQVFGRPEIHRSSIGRKETPEEAALEPFFRKFLQKVVDHMGRRVEYFPAAGVERAQRVVVSPSSEKAGCTVMEVRVLTPEFYSELVRSSNILGVFEKYCFEPAKGQQMLQISEDGSFRKGLDQLCMEEVGAPNLGFIAKVNVQLRTSKYLPWAVLLGLIEATCPQQRPGRPLKSLDTLIMDECSVPELAIYEANSMIVLLADRLALGYSFLLRHYGRLIRYLVVWMAVVRVSVLVRSAHTHGVHLLDLIGILYLVSQVVFIDLLRRVGC